MIKNRHDKTYQINKELAELIGAYLGDGTLTKYFIRFSGDPRYDKSYFNYLSKLIEQVVRTTPTIRWDSRKGKNVFYLEFWSKKFNDFLIKEFDLKPGNKIKNKAKIPKRITCNKTLLKSCIRGLVDTDGFVGCDGKTFSIRLGSHNPVLLKQVDSLGKSINIFTFKTKREVGTRKWKNIEKYFNQIGSSNLRHIVRFNEYKLGNQVKKKQILKYYPKYKYQILPFMSN